MNNWGRKSIVINLPYAHSCMTSGFWDSEKSEIMIWRGWYWSVLRPIIGKVMNELSLASVDHCFPSMSIRVIGRSNKLNIRTLFVKILCITSPFIKSWFLVICHWWVRLQVIQFSIKPWSDQTKNKVKKFLLI